MADPMVPARRREIARRSEVAVIQQDQELLERVCSDDVPALLQDIDLLHAALNEMATRHHRLRKQHGRLIAQRNAVLDLASQEHADAAADIHAGGPPDQLDGLSVPVHDLLIAVGVLKADAKTPRPASAADERRRNLVAAVVGGFHAREAVLCEHTQMVDYRGCADAVLAALDTAETDRG